MMYARLKRDEAMAEVDSEELRQGRERECSFLCIAGFLLTLTVLPFSHQPAPSVPRSSPRPRSSLLPRRRRPRAEEAQVLGTAGFLGSRRANEREGCSSRGAAGEGSDAPAAGRAGGRSESFRPAGSAPFRQHPAALATIVATVNTAVPKCRWLLNFETATCSRVLRRQMPCLVAENSER